MSLITKSTYLRGPKGDIGLQGPRGERGLAGVQGAQGIQGPDADPEYIKGQFSATGNITYNYLTGVIGFADPGYATISYVDTTLANLIGNAPAVLDTLKEIADAINNDPNFYNSKLNVSGGTMTGTLILDADPADDLGAATKQYVDNTTINDLTDVDTMTTEPTDGQALVWSALTSNWVPGQAIGGTGNSVIITAYNFTATAGQTEFYGEDFDDQQLSFEVFDGIQVFKNGILLRKNLQYNLNDGGWVDYEETNDILSLVTATNLDDWIHIVVTNTIGNVALILEGGDFTDFGNIFDAGTY